MKARISRIILFVRDVERVAAFYEKHFPYYADLLKASGVTDRARSVSPPVATLSAELAV